MSINEKTAYLKGLLEGLNIDETKPEGKLLVAIVDTLEEMANEISDLNEVAEYLDDYIDEVDHDLGDLETEYYELWDEDDDDEDYCFCDDCEDCDCDCDDCDCDCDCDCEEEAEDAE